MLRISKLADYAILIMGELAKEFNKICSASFLAKKLNLSLAVVSKILKILCQAELISSVRGMEGGYRSNKEAHQISIAEIIAAIEGDFGVTECCRKENYCEIEGSCGTKRNWQVINNVIYSTLAKLTVKDIMQPLPGTITSV